MSIRGIGLILALSLTTAAAAQEPYEGLTLISPLNSFDSHLIDMDGNITHTWHGSQTPGSIGYLLADDALLRPCVDTGGHFEGGGTGGRIQIIDADDNLIWDYLFSTYEYQQHHDIEPMPNGNVLLIAWERKTQQEAEDMGRLNLNGEMWPTLIVEIEPNGTTGGNVAWEWHLWDHLIQDVDPLKPNYGVIADHPELMDINAGSVHPQGGDWIHANAIDYNEELDQIIFSARSTDEFYILDHSTSTEEAATHSGGNCGKGGDFLYRWGNPENYGRGGSADRVFDVVHGVNWIDPGLPGAGNIFAFNNGDRPGSVNDYSSVYEIEPPVEEDGNYTLEPGEAYGPAAPVWEYGGPGDFYVGPAQGGAYRLPNGNALICSPPGGDLFEVSEAGIEVWSFAYGTGNIARAQRYAETSADVPFDDDLSGTPPLLQLDVHPTLFSPSVQVRFRLSEQQWVRLAVNDIRGRQIVVLTEGVLRAGEHLLTWGGANRAGRQTQSGVYFVRCQTGDSHTTRRVFHLR